MPSWIISLGAICELVLRILASFNRLEVHLACAELASGETDEDKQKAAKDLAALIYNRDG